MPNKATLRANAQAKLDYARALYAAGRYDGAVYLCGYAVEFALKARICDLLETDPLPRKSAGLQNPRAGQSGLEARDAVRRRWERLAGPSPRINRSYPPTFVHLMNTLAKKVASILPELEARGPVYLYAFAERTEGDWWDVVLSAEWSDQGVAEPIRFVIDLLWPKLEPKERWQIAQTSIVQSDRPKLQELMDEVDTVNPADGKVIYFSLLGTDIRRALIFRAQRPPAVPAERSVVGTLAPAS